MTEEIISSLPVSLLEELRRFFCKGYLSCGPVQCLNNYICESCPSLNTDAPIHRNDPVEAILSKISFPCIFKKDGCPELLLFGKVREHESECTHKPVVCPTNTSATCSWKGKVSQLLQHFKDNHPDFLTDQAEFQLEVNKDEQGLLMTVKNSYVLIVRYIYKANEKSLQYDIRCCTKKNGEELSWNVQLINSTYTDCKINMTMKECLPYYENFYDMQNIKSLDLNEFLERLNDPECIRVVLKLKVIKSNCDNILTENDLEAIKNLKCSKCYHYLVPPLFDLRGKTICNKCSKKSSNCKPCKDANLLKLVNEAKYPCHWRVCNFVGKSNIVEQHESNCQFRLRSCVYTICTDTFKFHEAVKHLRLHLIRNKVFIPANEFKYKTSFADTYTRKRILTINIKKVVLLTYKMNEGLHVIEMYQTSGSPTNVSGILVFEHKHYKCKSKEFTVDSHILEIDIIELPTCFKKTDELTVTIKLLCS